MCEISSSSAFNFRVFVCRSKSAQSDLRPTFNQVQPGRRVHGPSSGLCLKYPPHCWERHYFYFWWMAELSAGRFRMMFFITLLDVQYLEFSWCLKFNQKHAFRTFHREGSGLPRFSVPLKERKFGLFMKRCFSKLRLLLEQHLSTPVSRKRLLCVISTEIQWTAVN